MEATYTYTKLGANPSQIEAEILGDTSILIGCSGALLRGESTLEIYMKAPLSSEELLALNSLVERHVPLEVSESVSPTLVSVVENERYSDEGLELTYRMAPVLYDIPAGNPGDISRFEISYPCTIMLLGATIDIHSKMEGDQFWMETVCPTTIGYLAEPTVIGETWATANMDASAHIFKGLDLLIADEVVARISDHSGAQFNTDRAWTQVYPAGTPIKIRMLTVEPYYVTTYPMVVWISRDTERGAIIRRGQKMAFFYKNNDGLAKKVQICLEYHT